MDKLNIKKHRIVPLYIQFLHLELLEVFTIQYDRRGHKRASLFTAMSAAYSAYGKSFARSIVYVPLSAACAIARMHTYPLHRTIRPNKTKPEKNHSIDNVPRNISQKNTQIIFFLSHSFTNETMMSLFDKNKKTWMILCLPSTFMPALIHLI